MNHDVGQHMMIGVAGKSLTNEEADFIVRGNIGGVILFARNIESAAQVRDLCHEIQSLRHRMPDRAPLFIGVDNEGGRVARLKGDFTTWPAAAMLGKIDSTSVTFKFASQMGAELRAVGININFAPCVDVLTNPSNPAIGDRAFGSDPELVGRMSSAAIRGFMKSGILPCAKHFPGHGNTTVDSHFELPVEQRSLDELRALELAPFKKALRARTDLAMMAHILFPNVDAEWPASLSSTFIRLLRDELRFRGLIFSDDLGMKALTLKWSAGEIAIRGLEAGLDVLLYCNEPEVPGVALEATEKAITDKRLNRAMVAAGRKRILDLKRARLAQPDPLDAEAIAAVVGCAEHRQLSAAIASGQVPEELVASGL